MSTAEKAGWKRIVALLFAGWFSIWVYRTLLTPIFAEIQATVGPQTDAAMGLVSSCYFLGYVCMQIPGGLLMDRVGVCRVLVPGFLLFAGGAAVVALARGMPALYLGSALAGVGTGTYYSGAFTLSTRWVPPQRRFFATAVVNSGSAAGMVAGLVASSLWVKQLGFAWQGLVLGAAVLAAAMAPAFALGLKGADAPPAKTARLPAQAPPPNTMSREVTAPARAAGLFTARHLTTYFFYFCTCYGYYMMVTWLPSFLEQERGITGAAVGLASSIVAVASIPGALFFGRLLDRFYQRKTLALVLLQLFAGCMLVLVACLPWAGAAVACLALYGFAGKQAVDPLVVPHITGLNTGQRLATGLGVFNFFGMSASVLAPAVTGAISDAAGTRVPGIVLGAGLLFASALLFCLCHRHNAAHPTSKESH